MCVFCALGSVAAKLTRESELCNFSERTSCLIMILLHIVSHTLFRGHSVLLPAQASSMSMERLFIQLSDDVYISKLTSMTGFVLQGHICIA